MSSTVGSIESGKQRTHFPGQSEAPSTLTPSSDATSAAASQGLVSITASPSARTAACHNMSCNSSSKASTLRPYPSVTTRVSYTVLSSPTPSSSLALPFPGPSPNTKSFLECFPGTFLCQSASTFAQCVQGAPGEADLKWSNTHYVSMGSVAAGTRCIPHSSELETEYPFISHDSLSGGGGPAGTYRNDSIVGSGPLGSCGADGKIRCLRNGKGWAQCDQSGWVDMGAVASGTKCVGNKIVGS